jgi:TRAP transporter TAXI family solute receptor
VDVVHGHQQLSLFNAHYDERCFLPIHVYDTATSRPVIATIIGVPTPDVAALDAKEPLDFFPLSPEQAALVRTRFPELTPSLIPSGTYPSLHEDIHTVSYYNFVVIHSNVSDDLAYRVVKAVFEHHQELVSAIPVAKDTIPANLDRDTFLPLHPGAARYYREIGVAIPPAIEPAF